MFSTLKFNIFEPVYLNSKSSLSVVLPNFFKPQKLNFLQFFSTYLFFNTSSQFKFYYLNLINVLLILILKIKAVSTFNWEQRLLSIKLNPFSFLTYSMFFNLNFFSVFSGSFSHLNNDPLSLVRLSFQSFYFLVCNKVFYSYVFNVTDKLKKIGLLGNLVWLANQNRNYVFLGVDLSNIELLSKLLKFDLSLRMNALYDIYAVDYPNRLKRFEIAYCFLSIYNNFRLFLKGFIPDNLYIKSISGIFSSANWLEREIWDLFGVFFINHKNLRRILTDYGFKGFPFRKDFPLTGYVEARFDESRYAVVYEPLEIAQEFRVFNFKSPWEV